MNTLTDGITQIQAYANNSESFIDLETEAELRCVCLKLQSLPDDPIIVDMTQKFILSLQDQRILWEDAHRFLNRLENLH